MAKRLVDSKNFKNKDPRWNNEKRLTKISTQKSSYQPKIDMNAAKERIRKENELAGFEELYNKDNFNLNS